MIRINLLGVPKARRGKRTAAVSTPGEGPSPVLVGLVMFVLTAGVLGYLYQHVNAEHDRMELEMAKANQEYQRLAEVKATSDKTQKEAAQFKRRVDVTNKLTAAKTGPADFLTKVAKPSKKTKPECLRG